MNPAKRLRLRAPDALTRPQEYGYANARIHAMRADLLGAAIYEEMIDVPTIAEAAAILEKTAYKQSLIESTIGRSGAELVEYALGHHFSDTCQKLRRIVPRRATDVLDALLGKWNVHNLKILVLGKRFHHSREKTQMLLVPAGSFTAKRLDPLIDAPTVEEMAAKLRHPRYTPLLRDNLDYDEDGTFNVNRLLEALDFHYYRQLLDFIQPVSTPRKRIRYLIQTEITAKNLMTILRAKKDGISPDDIENLIIGGGRISAARMRSFIEAKDVKDVVGLLRHIDMRDALARYEHDGSLTHFEVVLEREIALQSLRTFSHSTLSMGTLTGFLYLKEEEMNNVRKIVRAKEHGIDAEQTREMLIAM